METRASYLLIGSFVLIAVAALFAFVIWLARVDVQREFTDYYIIFDEAVTGLTVGGAVRYNGIPVGTVEVIEVDPDNPARVRVTARIRGGTAIRTDTVAQLQLQGITGLSFVQLSGGTAEAEILRPGPGDGPPVIRSEPSAISELFAGGPELINRITLLVEELTKLAGPENQQAIASILANSAALSERLERRGPEVEQLIVELTEAAAGLNDAAQRIDDLVESADVTLSVARGALSTADDVVDNDARQALRQMAAASARFERVGARLETLIGDNEEALTAFASDGLVEFTRFLEEARLLVAAGTRLIEGAQKDPQQFLFGSQESGFEAQSSLRRQARQEGAAPSRDGWP